MHAQRSKVLAICSIPRRQNAHATHLALGASSARCVNPDVLGDDGTLLIELEVFLELCRVSTCMVGFSKGIPTLAVFER